MLPQLVLFHSFYGQVVFQCIYGPHLVYPFIGHGHLGCFHVLAIVNRVAMNAGVHIAFPVKVLSGYMPRGGIAGSNGKSSFLRNLHTVLHSGLHQSAFMVGVLKLHFFCPEGSLRFLSASRSVLQPILSSVFKATLPPLSDSTITEPARAAPSSTWEAAGASDLVLGDLSSSGHLE